jgi:hypothetical protein
MKLKPMSELQIAAKLKAGKPFKVSTKREQNIALTGAKILGIKISTRKDCDDDMFAVFFI